MYGNGTKLRGILVKCPKEDKNVFHKSHVALLISVGQKYHEEERLQATIKFINDQFKSCSLMVNDTLQKYTHAFLNGLTLSDAEELAGNMGEKWINRNSDIYSKLRIPYDVFRWNDWLSNDVYPKMRNDINTLYQSNEAFRQATIATANEFLERNINKINTDLQTAFQLCVDYLLEETAIIFNLWQNRSYDFILYPGEIIKIMDFYWQNHVSKNELKWLHIRFKRNNKSLYRASKTPHITGMETQGD